MSQIAIIGGTGYAGGHIASEAASRGHGVVTVSRTAPTDADDRLTVRTGSIEDRELLDELFGEADVVIVAIRSTADGEPFLVRRVPELLALSAEHGTRLGFVGGAGSLQVSPGGARVLDSPGFPETAKPEANAHALVLAALRDADTEADWFYLSPAGGFGSYAPGERTGQYRTGDDVLVVGPNGKSEISGADFAIAIVDEIEQPAHHQTRFTVGY